MKTRPHISELKALFALGIPLAGSQIAAFAVHMTDVIMMGWYGIEELAALVIGSGYWFVIFIMLAGFAFAVMPLVAKASGSGDTTTVRRATRMAIWLSILSAVLVYPAFLWSSLILDLLGQGETVADLAQEYLVVAGIEMVPALIVMVFRSYFSALGRTRIILVAVLSGVVANAFLNYILIFGNFGFPALGVMGSAIASLIVQSGMMIGFVLYAHIKTPENDLFRNPFRPDWEILRKVGVMGVPIGITALAEVGLFNAAAVMMGWLGTVELAAHGVALQIAALAFMLQIGISQAATIRVGQAFGREDEAALRLSARVAVVASVLLAALSAVVFVVAPELLVGLFIAPDEPQRDAVLVVAAQLVIFAAFFQISDGGQVTALALLRGVHDTAVPMWLATISYWVIGLPIAYVFGFIFDQGATGVWLGLLFGLTSAWVLMSIRFWAQKARLPVAVPAQG